MMFEINRIPPIFSVLRMCESRLVFEVRLIISTMLCLISTVSFRAKARNLVFMPLATNYCRLAAQRGIKLLASNDIVMRASLEHKSVCKLYSVIRFLVCSLIRPFSRREKDRMRERKYIFTRSPHPIPLPEGEGVLSRLPGRAFCRAEERL